MTPKFMITELESPVLIEYLEKKGIPFQLASKFCKEAYYKVGQRILPVIVFPNDKGGYEIESPQISHSVGTRTLTTIKTNQTNKSCMVFLNFMDFLSFHAQMLKDGYMCSLPLTDCLILNTYMQVGRARKILSNYNKFTCHFPNTIRGEAALKEMLTISGCVSWGLMAMSNSGAASIFAEYLIANA